MAKGPVRTKSRISTGTKLLAAREVAARGLVARYITSKLNAVDFLMLSATYPIFDASGSPGTNTTFVRATTATDPLNLNSSVPANRARVRPFVLGSKTIYAPMIEGARTNLCQQSENLLSSPWSAESGVYGYSGGFLSEDGTSGTHSVLQSISGTTNGDILNLSVIASAGTRNWIIIRMRSRDNATYNYANFNLSNGTIGTIIGGWTAAISQFGSGYKCSISGSVGTGAISPEVGIYICNGDNSFIYTGTNGYGLYVSNVQVEIGAFHSTYIPTTGTAVTRDADVCTWTVGSALAAGKGTLFGIGNDSTYKQQHRIVEGTASQIDCLIGRDTGGLESYLSGFLYNGAISTPTGQYTLAMSWDGTTRKSFCNGSLINSQSSSAVAVGTQLSLQGWQLEAFDHILPIFFSRVLTDAEIALLHSAALGTV